MAVTREEKEARRLWEEHCKRVQSLTGLSPEAEKETRAERTARIRRLLAHYPDFCEYYFPHYMRQTDPATGLQTGIVHNAPFHNAAYLGRLRTPAKSGLVPVAACTRPGSQRGVPRHLHPHQPHGARRRRDPLRARNAGQRTLPGTRHPYQPKLRCGRSRLADLQAELEYNQRLIADFGMQKNVGDWQQGTLRLPERRWRHFAG